jgi:DNA-binding MarR family transcriptional regulator
LNTNGSKFYLKSLTLLAPILEMIIEGATQTKIAEILGTKKPYVSYYIRRAIEIGYIKKIVQDKIKIYELTQQGKSFLDQYNNNRTHAKQQLPSCRAENVRFKAPVYKFPARPPNWHKVEMNNWSQYNSIVDNIRIKLNMGKTPSIEFLPSPIDGDDPWKLFGILYNDLVVHIIPKMRRALR